MNSSKINYIIFGLAMLSSMVGALQVFDWTAFLTKDQTIAVMSALSGFGAVLKGWMATAEAYAKQITAGQVSQ